MGNAEVNPNPSLPISRRTLLQGTGLALGGTALVNGTADAHPPGVPVPGPGSPVRPIPVPEQVPATQGLLQVPGARLWYWDTGGPGEPVVLLHALSGSGESWPYQQPYLARAGYRVIGYSRRGYANSPVQDPNDPRTGIEDLHDLVEFLGVGKFHVVGVAGGGWYAMDYALNHPDRLHSLVIGACVLQVRERDYQDMVERLRSPEVDALPIHFRELGPSYRAIDPDGVARWLDSHHRAGPNGIVQPRATSLSWAVIERLTVPTLLLWGDADPHTSPPVQRLLAGHFRRVSTMVANECGHNVHWERSDVVNPVLRNFFRANRH
ncbi:Twin-arginine translocation pathway signal [Amycolatopsis coloradensis]|uniref:Twin-arginine translocation pathway signal n=3 Tax=Amycolatopsis coloradensis TaxID=76021 RepID=A0A1R0KR21_9PSEU|nr:alpha/beta hydrolase [Amycolatopsis coloradensis]OLZ50078.1 Twin-arginine translocation pathway signal [Amycolatopsis coloradensis]